MLKHWAVWALMVLPLSLPAAADSHVRIVRLSNVEGNVQMDRNTGQGYEKAFLNMPVVQGALLATKDDARAEVEFEDGSTIRLTPNSTLEFTELTLRESGARATTLTLKSGQVYVGYKSSQKNDEFAVLFAGQKMKLTEEVHLRIDLEDTTAQIAVFKGAVNVEGPAGTAELSKGRSATFDLADEDKFKIAKNIEEDPYDEWDQQQAKYHDQYSARNQANANYPYGYGVSDLNYYGNYTSVPGYGTMWQPYFAGPGWNPFMDGAWMFYPGLGYTWVSGYPWGWMPFMYGGWNYVAGYGWGWMPGGWNGWNTVPQVGTPPNRFNKPQPPGRGTATVMVGRGMSALPAVPPQRMTVQAGTAGLGIPRGSGNLGRVSEHVSKTGFATVHTSQPSMGSWGSFPSSGGYPPARGAAGGASRSSSGMGGGGMHSGGGVGGSPHR